MKISYNKIVIFVVTICFISVSAVIFYSLFDKSHEDNARIRFQKRHQEYLSNLNDKKLIEIKDKELEALVSEFIDMDIDEEKKANLQ